MKRVLFLMRYPLDDAYNLKLKFKGQMRACVNLGYEVYYIGYDSSKYYLCSVNSKNRRVIGSTHFYKTKRYRNTIAFFDLYSTLDDLLENEQFDYIYMRKKMVTPKAVSALNKHKSTGGKLIVEIPSYGVNEASLGFVRNMAKHIFAKTESSFEKLIDLYTLIGNDCPSTYKGMPSMEIVNGVSLDTIKMKKRTEPNFEIHMLAVASMRDWQGLDRIIRGMGNYTGEKRLVLHLVGQDFDGSVLKWLKLAENLGVASDVVYHGPLYNEKLSELFDICHMAIGSLAFHRKGTSVGSPLKVREYMARGIPFIYAYNDSTLTGNEWFALNFPADDSDIDFNRVVSWIMDIYTREGSLDEIRQFARDHLSWETQFDLVFKRLES